MNWCTPQDFFNELDLEFHFVLDAAATEKSAKCARYFTPETDGLSQSWDVGGAVFCNPPYGRQIGAWVKKAYAEATRGGVHRCFAYPGADGYGILPRLHISESGNPVYSRALEIHRRRRQREAIRAVSVDGRYLQGDGSYGGGEPELIFKQDTGAHCLVCKSPLTLTYDDGKREIDVTCATGCVHVKSTNADYSQLPKAVRDKALLRLLGEHYRAAFWRLQAQEDMEEELYFDDAMRGDPEDGSM